jgi:NTP pyrophosphatase (non-canonical NTP hydrolase)
MRNLNQYQQSARKTAIYPPEHGIIYTALGLNGETGEIAEKVKKVIRDRDGIFDKQAKTEMAKELGDVLWYVANMAHEIGYALDEVADINLQKLESRAERGKIKGDGDNR